MATQRNRFRSIFLVELYLESGLRVFATDNLYLTPTIEVPEGTLGGYNVGGYSGITGSSGDQGYDA